MYRRRRVALAVEPARAHLRGGCPWRTVEPRRTEAREDGPVRAERPAPALLFSGFGFSFSSFVSRFFVSIFRNSSLGIRDSVYGFRGLGFQFRISGLGFRVYRAGP